MSAPTLEEWVAENGPGETCMHCEAQVWMEHDLNPPMWKSWEAAGICPARPDSAHVRRHLSGLDPGLTTRHEIDIDLANPKEVLAWLSI